MATTNKAFRVKNGLTVEGAELRPAAGTATYPPILLTSGTNLTTATAGAFEFDGTNFYLTPSSTRKTISFTDHVHGNITSAGAIGSTANLVLVTTTSGAITVATATNQSSTTFLRGDLTWVTPTDTNYYPTALTYTGGTTAGPVATIAMTGASNITADAIPVASATASGVVTTAAQTFAGVKSMTSPDITTSITTPSTTFALVNATATTVNFAGAGTAINIGAATGNTTVNNNLIVTGNLTVNGTTTTVNSTTVTVDDIVLELGAVTTPTDTTANGGGISLSGATNKTILWDSTNSNWTSSEHWNIASGKLFKIANTEVLSATKVLGLTPTTSGTGFSIAGGATSKTLTVSNSLTLAGTDSTTMTFPSSSSTVMTLAQPGTLTGTLTLRAGTATAGTAPLYLQSGTNLTTAAAGALEFDGTSLYFTPTTTRKTIAFTDSTMSGNTTGSAATLTTSRTLWGQSFNGSANVTGLMTGVTSITGTSGSMFFVKAGDYTSTSGQGNHTYIYGGQATAVTGTAQGGNVYIYGGISDSGSGTTGSINIGAGEAVNIAGTVKLTGVTSGTTQALLRIDNSTGQVYKDSSTSYVTAASPALTGTPTINSIAGLVTASGSTTGTTALTLSTIYSSSTYSGGEFIVKATNGSNIEITKILVVTDGTNVYVTNYGDVYVSSSLITVDFSYSTTNVNMVVTPVAGTTGTTTVKVWAAYF